MESSHLSTEHPTEENTALDHLLHSKSRVLRTKLETMAAEIQTRFAIWNQNLNHLNQEQSELQNNSIIPPGWPATICGIRKRFPNCRTRC